MWEMPLLPCFCSHKRTAALHSGPTKTPCSEEHEQKGRHHPIPTPSNRPGPGQAPGLQPSCCCLQRGADPSTNQLQAQPLDILAAEVNSESQHLPDFGWSKAPGERAWVWAPVIQDLRHLEKEESCRRQLAHPALTGEFKLWLLSRYFLPLTPAGKHPSGTGQHFQLLHSP